MLHRGISKTKNAEVKEIAFLVWSIADRIDCFARGIEACNLSELILQDLTMLRNSIRSSSITDIRGIEEQMDYLYELLIYLAFQYSCAAWRTDLLTRSVDLIPRSQNKENIVFAIDNVIVHFKKKDVDYKLNKICSLSDKISYAIKYFLDTSRLETQYFK